MKKIFCLLFLIAFTLPGCEKDDICDGTTNTTPRMVVSFYDAANRLNLKNVTNLKVIADGVENGIEFNPSATGDLKYLTNSNTIKIPLNTAADVVKYRFILNANTTDRIDTDTIQLNYYRNNVFVSRACGYSYFFTLSNTPELPAFILNDNSPDGLEAWIKDIDVSNYNLTNENETHLNIYF